MSRRALWTAMLLAMPVGMLVTACGDRTDQRAALEDEELDRELDLVLRGDTVSPGFQDTGTGVEATPTPGSSPSPSPQPQATQPPRATTPQPQPRQDDTPRVVPLTVPVGTTFAIRLNDQLGTDRNQPGDPFTATVADPIVTVDGTVLIPAGAIVRGRVTASEMSNRVGETAVIKVAFESVSFGGRSYAMQASVVEANPERRTRTTATQQAAKVAVGAAAGAILGQVIGRDTEGTLKGAAVGAAAGTAIAMGTADVDAVLPEGSRMVIRLDTPVEVQR